MIELDLYQWLTDCYRCDSPTPVAWAHDPDPDSHPRIGEELVGETLAESSYANVERRYSQTIGDEVYGNVCIECDAYQGNHFIQDEVMHTAQRKETRTTITITPPCAHCGAETTRLRQFVALCGDCTMKTWFDAETDEE